MTQEELFVMVTAGVIELGLWFRRIATCQKQYVGHDCIRPIAAGRRGLYTWLRVMAF